MSPSWNDFVGLPWLDKGRDRNGINCWGINRLQLLEFFAIEVPSYTEAFTSTEEKAEISALFQKTREWPWVQIAAGTERAHDLLVFGRPGREYHCATVTKPGLMLHIERGKLSCIEPYVNGRFVSPLSGIYRHAELTGRPR